MLLCWSGAARPALNHMAWPQRVHAVLGYIHAPAFCVVWLRQGTGLLSWLCQPCACAAGGCFVDCKVECGWGETRVWPAGSGSGVFLCVTCMHVLTRLLQQSPTQSNKSSLVAAPRRGPDMPGASFQPNQAQGTCLTPQQDSRLLASILLHKQSGPNTPTYPRPECSTQLLLAADPRQPRPACQVYRSHCSVLPTHPTRPCQSDASHQQTHTDTACPTDSLHSSWVHRSHITGQGGGQGEARLEGACRGVHRRGGRQGRVGASATQQQERQGDTREAVMMNNTRALALPAIHRCNSCRSIISEGCSCRSGGLGIWCQQEAVPGYGSEQVHT
jgi:hypothetical protein